MGKMIFLPVLFVFLTVNTSWCKPRVAVMDFENKTRHGGWRLGRGAADMLTTEMVKTGSMDMYERERLASVIKEQNLGASGRVDPNTAARIGKIIGVQYIITGAVTEYGRSSTSGGGGGVKVGKIDYNSTVDIRMVDAVTGSIVFADTGSHSISSMNVKVFGFGGGQKFNEKAATEAMRCAIKAITQKLAAYKLKSAPSQRAPGNAAGKALVADVDGNLITLNKGSGAGFKAGQELTIQRKGKVIKDPATGKVLKVKYKTVGKIKLSEVESGYSEGTIVSGAGFKVGDIVK
jgi:curli biogenesis system outer membrane secretion channel CsgG